MYGNESNKKNKWKMYFYFETARESIKPTKMHTFIGYWNRNLNDPNDVQTDTVQMHNIYWKQIYCIDKKNYCGVWPIN